MRFETFPAQKEVTDQKGQSTEVSRNETLRETVAKELKLGEHFPGISAETREFVIGTVCEAHEELTKILDVPRVEAIVESDTKTPQAHITMEIVNDNTIDIDHIGLYKGDLYLHIHRIETSKHKELAKYLARFSLLSYMAHEYYHVRHIVKWPKTAAREYNLDRRTQYESKGENAALIFTLLYLAEKQSQSDTEEEKQARQRILSSLQRDYDRFHRIKNFKSARELTDIVNLGLEVVGEDIITLVGRIGDAMEELERMLTHDVYRLADKLDKVLPQIEQSNHHPSSPDKDT